MTRRPHIIAAGLLAIAISGCEKSGVRVPATESQFVEHGGTISTIDYDGCEYVQFSHGAHASITHKGNCKNCAKR